MSLTQPEARVHWPSPTEAEYAFTPRDFQHIAEMLHADTGIVLAEAKAPLVYARLVKRLRALGLQSFSAYCRLVASDAGAEERRTMLISLTTNVTRFFREPHHFEHLAKTALPPLVEAAKRGRRVRLWSAGCSSGEEPYSIAMTVLEALPDAARYDLKILATDIDSEMLRRGRAGRYSQNEVSPVPAAMRERWLIPAADEPGRWEVGRDLRKLVAFKELNLIGEWPMRGPFQVIFCRNVVIYFDPETQSSVWRKLIPLMDAGAHLFIGHSERVGEAGERLRPVGLTAYQLPAETV